MSQTWNFPMLGSASLSASRTVINDGAEAVRTLHSGSSAPSSTVAYMFWADTATGKLKMRDATNAAWVIVADLPASGTDVPTNFGHLRIDGTTPMTGSLDLDGQTMIIDADADSSLSAAVDDTILIAAEGETVMALSRISNVTVIDLAAHGTFDYRLDLDVDNDTSLRCSADDTLKLEVNGADVETWSSNPLQAATESVTISGATSDAYSAGLRLTPVYAAGSAQTVTRSNYLDLVNPDGGANVTITDAAVLRFNAAAGTHKAVDSGTTKTTPGTVDAWVKVNVNGTIHYLPAYTSKTS